MTKQDGRYQGKMSGRKPVTTSPCIVDTGFNSLWVWALLDVLPLLFHRAMSFCLGADDAPCSGRWMVWWLVMCAVMYSRKIQQGKHKIQLIRIKILKK